MDYVSEVVWDFLKSSTSTAVTALSSNSTHITPTPTPTTEHATTEHVVHEKHGQQVVIFSLFFFAVSGAFIRHFLKRIPLPYTVILVIYGFAMGAAIQHEDPNDFFRKSVERFTATDGHVILFVFLPPLLFESSFALDQEIFWRVKWQVVLLAGPGLAIATFLTAAMIHPVLKDSGWTFTDALLMGAITAATDPVAVVAMLKELGASKRIGHVIEGESMVNDGTAIVMFNVVIEIVKNAHFLKEQGFWGVAWLFIKMPFGAVILGVAIGFVGIEWIQRVFNDPFVEITVTLTLAYLAFFIAEHVLGLSGVITVVCLGFYINVHRVAISPEVEHFLHEFWSITSFLANTLIFVLIGLAVHSANKEVMLIPQNWFWAIVVYIVVNFARSLMIVALSPILRFQGYGFKIADGILLVWGGLRGAVALVLAIVANQTYKATGNEIVGQQMLFYVSGLVLLTLVVNAPTMPRLIRGLGVDKVSREKFLELQAAATQFVYAGQRKISTLKKSAWFSGTNWDEARSLIPAFDDLPRYDNIRNPNEEFVVARTRFLKAIRRSYHNSHKEGLIGPQALRHLLHSISECVALDLPSSMEWDLLKKRVLQPPDFRRFGLKSIAELINDSSNHFVSRIGKTMLYRSLRDQTDVAYGFAVARNEVAELLPMVSKNPNIVQRLRQDCIAGRRESSQFLKNMITQYGVIVRAVQTSSAARQILYVQRSEIHHLVEEGVLDEDDEVRFLETVETSIKRVLAYNPLMEAPDPETVVAEVSWLAGQKSEAVQAIMGISEHFPARRGVLIGCGEAAFESPKSHLVQIDSKAAPHEEDDIFLVILTEGLVEVLSRDMFTESADQSDAARERAQAMSSTRQSHVSTLGPGTVLGETSLLTGKPDMMVVRSVSDQTTFARISLASLRNTLVNFPEVESGIIQAGAIKIAREVLQFVDPFKHWPRSVLSLWLEEGEVERYDTANSITLTHAAVLLVGQAQRENISGRESAVINGPELLLTGPPEPGREPTYRIAAGSRIFHIKTTSIMDSIMPQFNKSEKSRTGAKSGTKKSKQAEATAQHSFMQELIDLSPDPEPAQPSQTHENSVEPSLETSLGLGEDEGHGHGHGHDDDHHEDARAQLNRGIANAMREVAFELCKACSAKDLARVKKLVNEGVPVNGVDYEMRTPLHVAAAQGCFDIVVYLLDERHANINPLDKRGHTPLNDCIVNHHDDVCNALIERGARVGEGKSEKHEVAVDLCVLARAGNTHDLRRMIDGGADLNKRDYEGRTALHIAASHGSFHAVELLVASGINVAIKDEFGHTALDDAIIAGAEDIAKLLRERGSPQTQTDASTLSLLKAAHSGNMKVTRSLIDAGGLEVSVKDLEGRTPLHIATARGNLDIVKFLVEHHASLDANDGRNQTPIEAAVLNGHDEVSKYLREKGSQVIRPTFEIVDHFMRAVFSGDLVIVKRVIENGLNPNQTDYKHRTGLHVAVAEGHTRIVEYLLDRGSDPNITDKHGESPLSVSMHDSNPQIIQMLLDHGGRHGSSRNLALLQQAHLMQAASHGDEAVVAQLLEGGLDPNITGPDRRTALHLASAEGHYDVCLTLLESGADVNATDRWHSTPLSDAYQNEHHNVAELLVDHGAMVISAADVMSHTADYADSQGNFNSVVSKTSTSLLKKVGMQKHRHTSASTSRSTVRPSGQQTLLRTNPDLLL
eukprot:c12703_g1_i1.p1 GENE.c12703_g1_i1~~c12703_g1_i1.p1  ORF type:complete len:1692 (-),score=437.89 c12703_g1_i1:416-5491(-)